MKNLKISDGYPEVNCRMSGQSNKKRQKSLQKAKDK